MREADSSSRVNGERTAGTGSPRVSAKRRARSGDRFEHGRAFEPMPPPPTPFPPHLQTGYASARARRTARRMLVRTRITPSRAVTARSDSAFLLSLACGRRHFAIACPAAARPTHHLHELAGSPGPPSPQGITTPARVEYTISHPDLVGRCKFVRTDAAGCPPVGGRRYASTAHARRPDPPTPEEDSEQESSPLPEPAPQYDTPRKLHQLLDSYVIAQTKAKKVSDGPRRAAAAAGAWVLCPPPPPFYRTIKRLTAALNLPCWAGPVNGCLLALPAYPAQSDAGGA